MVYRRIVNGYTCLMPAVCGKIFGFVLCVGVLYAVFIIKTIFTTTMMMMTITLADNDDEFDNYNESFLPVIVVTVSKFYVLTFDNANKLKAINFNFVGSWPYQNQKCFELGKCGCGMFYIPEANNDFIKSKLLNG